jgi:hypothetical protein
MPNPKDFDNKQDWMDACMSQQKDEGKNLKKEDERDQAVAICLNMWGDKNKKKASKAKVASAAKALRNISQKLEELGK